MQLVSLEDIPSGPYQTPLDNRLRLLANAQNMEILCRYKNGMGLHAAQVGLPWRMFVYWSNYPNVPQKFECLIDCEYAPVVDEKFSSIEGCLSLPGMHFELERYNEVLVSGKRLSAEEDTANLKDFKETFKGVLAVVLQHEIDHDYGREKMIDKIGVPIHLSKIR